MKELEELEAIMFLEECDGILQNKLPLKLNDPENFSIPCTIGNESFDKALCDLRASVSLMSFPICRKLDIRELKPITMTL